MGEFYKNYVAECNRIGKSPSAVALENGLSKPAVNGWKTGKSNPTDATLMKFADYFGVSVEYLKGEEQKNTATEDGSGSGLKSTNYDKLSDENKFLINQMIEKLIESQSGG